MRMHEYGEYFKLSILYPKAQATYDLFGTPDYDELINYTINSIDFVDFDYAKVEFFLHGNLKRTLRMTNIGEGVQWDQTAMAYNLGRGICLPKDVKQLLYEEYYKYFKKDVEHWTRIEKRGIEKK